MKFTVEPEHLICTWIAVTSIAVLLMHVKYAKGFSSFFKGCIKNVRKRWKPLLTFSVGAGNSVGGHYLIRGDFTSVSLFTVFFVIFVLLLIVGVFTPDE